MKSWLQIGAILGIAALSCPLSAQTASFSPSAVSVGAGAGSGTTGLTISPAGSAWTASSNAPWLTVTQTSGNGSAILDYGYASNLGTADPRTATIKATVSGATANFVVNQAGAPLSLSSTSASVSGSAGSGTFTVTTGTGVTWTASSNAAWLTVTPSGTGSATVTYNYADTTTLTSRIGVITIGGQAFTVTQAGAVVTFSPSAPLLGATAGTQPVTLIVTPDTASWRAGRINGNWLDFTPRSGVGTTELTFTYPANPFGSRRLERIWVADADTVFYYEAATLMVTQLGGIPGFNDDAVTVGANAGSGTIQLSIDPPDMPWTATVIQNKDAENNDWLTVSPMSGVGNAALQYDYSINLGVRARIATIVVGGQRFAVAQRGAGGDYSAFGTTFATQVAALPLENVRGITVDGAGNFYVLWGEKIYKLYAQGGDSILFDLASPGPTDLAASVTGKTIWVARPLQCQIAAFSFNGGDAFLAGGVGGEGCGWSGEGTLGAQAYTPRSVAVDPTNNMFYIDNDNYRVRRREFSLGLVFTMAGNGQPTGTTPDGPSATAGPIIAKGIAVDRHGNLYLTESCKVRRVDVSKGTLSTIAGIGCGFGGDGDLAVVALLSDPRSLAIDGSGNIYVVDGARIRRIDGKTQIITTIAGNGTYGHSGDGGPAHLATVGLIDKIAVDAVGNLYFTTTGEGHAHFIDFTAPRPPLTVTADDASREYGLANPVFTGTVNTPQPGDTVTATGSTTANAASAVGTYAIIPTAQGPDAWKYEVTPVNGTLTVTPAPLSVSANSFSRAYGAANPVFTGTVGPTRNGDVIGATYTTTATPASLPGTYPIVPVPSGSKLPNYIVNATNGTLTINDVVFTLARPIRPARKAGAGGASQVFTLDVTGVAAGQAVSIACSAPAGLRCAAPKGGVTDAAGLHFEVTLRDPRPQRLKRLAPGQAQVTVQIGAVRKQLTLP